MWGGEKLTPGVVSMVVYGTSFNTNDVALLQVQGFEVVSDNDSVLENIPAQCTDGGDGGIFSNIYSHGWFFLGIDL